MNSIKGKWNYCIFVGLLCLSIIACEKKATEQAKPVGEHESMKMAPHNMEMAPHKMDMAAPKIAKQVLVPDEVKDKWPMLHIVVKDKSSGNSVSYEVKPNSAFEIPETNLKLKIGEFLPHFTMNAEQITSLSAELNNPALQVTIHEGEAEKYSGWLFSKFTEMHAFEHEKYSIILEDKFDTEGPAGKI